MGRAKGTCSKCNRTGLKDEDYYPSVPAWCRLCFLDYQTGRSQGKSLSPAPAKSKKKLVRPDGNARVSAGVEFVPPTMSKKEYMKSLINTPIAIPEHMQQALVKGRKRMGPQEPTSLASLPQYIRLHADPGASYALEIASMIKSGTENGKSIIEFWLRVLYDENVPLKYRFAVSQELANRLFGKPPQEITGSVDVTHKAINARVGGLSDAELAELGSPADLEKYITVEVVGKAIAEKAVANDEQGSSSVEQGEEVLDVEYEDSQAEQ